jgi:hypothetical protein
VQSARSLLILRRNMWCPSSRSKNNPSKKPTDYTALCPEICASFYFPFFRIQELAKQATGKFTSSSSLLRLFLIISTWRLKKYTLPKIGQLIPNYTASNHGLLLLLLDGGGTKSTRYCGHFWPIVQVPYDRWGWLWSNWRNEHWQGKPKYSEKTCPSATLSTTNPTWPDPGSNPGRRGGKPTTNRLSYGAISRKIIYTLRIDLRQDHRFQRFQFSFVWPDTSTNLYQ